MGASTRTCMVINIDNRISIDLIIVVVVACRVNDMQVMFSLTSRDNVNVYRSGKNKSFFFQKTKVDRKKIQKQDRLKPVLFFLQFTPVFIFCSDNSQVKIVFAVKNKTCLQLFFMKIFPEYKIIH